MASTAKEKFDAAIDVIHSLPKDGPFQPSNEMMLTFYGYFKQATEGPCKLTKPSFWEVVKKAKWDAWNKLGNMDKETAMDLYVEELKKTLRVCAAKWNEMDQTNDPRIVEAMPQTHVVGKFMQTLGAFYELVDEEPPMKGVTKPSKQSPDSSADSVLSNTSMENVENKINDMSSIVESAMKSCAKLEEDTERLIAETQSSEDSSLANGPTSLEESEEELVHELGDRPESLGSRSMSESEDEFCDTSDNPLETQLVKPKVKSDLEVQMSTPLKAASGQSRVHFAEPPSDTVQNGRISPILQNGEEGEQYVYMPPGFPYLSKKVDREISDSMMVSVGDSSLSAASISNMSRLNGTSPTGDFSANNSSYIELPSRGGRRAEGGEEPKDTRRNQGQGQKQGSGSGSSRQGSSRGNFSGSGQGRRALLTEGASGGEGEDNPPQDQYGPQQGTVDDQIGLVLLRLQQDMSTVLNRLDRLETEIRHTQRDDRSISNRFLAWWPFTGRTGRSAFFILVWPVIVHLILSYLMRRRRRTH